MKVFELIEALSKVEGDREVCLTYDSRVVGLTVTVVDTFEGEDGSKWVALRGEDEGEYAYYSKPIDPDDPWDWRQDADNILEKNIVTIFAKFD
jgi:hypothetical protein